MQVHLQATGLEVWNVVSEGIKFKTLKEKQHDVTAKRIILSSLSDNVFNRVYACENAYELWKTIIENHKGTEDIANERYHVLLDRLNRFKQLDDENAESMYSQLNTLVNEFQVFNLLHT